MFKRPIPRVKPPPLGQFVTQTGPGGALYSSWQVDVRHQIIPSGTPGVVGKIVDKMRLGLDSIKRPEKNWTPPMEHELVARHMEEPARTKFLERCAEWNKNHPPKVSKPRKVIEDKIDYDLILALGKKWGAKRPPLDERLAVYKAAGYSDEYLETCKRNHEMLEAKDDERQAALDAIFAKWPSASKPTPKTKRKSVIKAVKKRA